MASEGDSPANNFIWAITLLVIVAILAGVVYYSGILGGSSHKTVDINVDTPATSSK